MQRPPQHISWTQLIIEKYILPILATLTVGLITGAIALYLAVRDLTGLVYQHDQQIKTLQTEIQTNRAAAVTRQELLETLKRVEQQLELVMLRAKINAKVKLTGD